MPRQTADETLTGPCCSNHPEYQEPYPPVCDAEYNRPDPDGSVRRLYCTRAEDHDGDHIACGDVHEMARWGDQ